MALFLWMHVMLEKIEIISSTNMDGSFSSSKSRLLGYLSLDIFPEPANNSTDINNIELNSFKSTHSFRLLDNFIVIERGHGFCHCFIYI